MSLHQFFRNCNLKSAHNVRWAYYSRVRFGRFYFLRYQCYSDGEQSDFVRLDRWFPNSLFILNNRNERNWLYSRIKHVLRYNENIDVNTILLSPKYGKMAKDFFSDEESAITKWISERRVYLKQAKLYFRGKRNFLEIDVTRDENWANRLMEFLKNNELQIDFKGVCGNIHKNERRKYDLTNYKLLEKYMKVVDEKLANY